VFPASQEIVATRILETLEQRPVFQSGVYGDGTSAESIANTVVCWDLKTQDMKELRAESSVTVNAIDPSNR
jgi:hypothetical protein